MYNRFILNRKTIEEVIYTEGIGIHTGNRVSVRLLPADSGTGIVFINKYRGMKSPIVASPDSVVDTQYAITLSNGEWQIKTVEHFLAVLFMLGITDILIEIDDEEMPIFDGSSSPIIKLFDEKRFRIFEEVNEPLKVINPIWMVEADKFVIVLPSDIPKISYTISYDHPLIQTQYAHFPLTRDVFVQEIAPARTYGFERDVEFLWKNSLAKGGSLSNALVISNQTYLNEPRFKDECVRHKIMDFIGDISLLGKPVFGYFIVGKSGHTFDIRFIRKIMSIYSESDIGTPPDLPGETRKEI